MAGYIQIYLFIKHAQYVN